jgi:hypothetical protein
MLLPWQGVIDYRDLLGGGYTASVRGRLRGAPGGNARKMSALGHAAEAERSLTRGGIW